MVDKQINYLIDEFVHAAEEHYRATLAGNSKKTNAQAKRIHKIFQEIIKFGHDGRMALLVQIHNENAAVAIMAATYSLKFSSEESLAILRRISQQPGWLGFGAEQAIKRWEEGNWHLE